jgi:hypothetical protein
MDVRDVQQVDLLEKNLARLIIIIIIIIIITMALKS